MARVECASVEIVQGRWNVAITMRDESGQTVEEYVASADSFFTERSGIWFGTRAEYDEASA